MPEIGSTLREARMRARLDVSEIEAQTKIRAKYLRALENEEWSLLPGPTFVKSFLRTYATALDLDGRALVEEYRLHHERPSDATFDPIVPSTQRARQRNSASGPSRGYTVAVGVVGLVIVVLVVLLIFGGKSKPASTAASTAPGTGTTEGSQGSAAHQRSHAGSPVIALSLKATGVLTVCLIGDSGRTLVRNAVLQPGASTPTFHARRFAMSLSSNTVTMFIDGRPRSVPPSAEPIGYSLTKATGRRTLSATQRPVC